MQHKPITPPAQVARRTELEGMKHALVVRKRCCRAMTGSAWKQLRAGMARRLAEQMAAAQTVLDEELAFIQVWGGGGPRRSSGL
jgi:hypothetical protein